MKQNCLFHSLKLIVLFAVLVLLTWLVSGCGSLVRVEYQNPKYGAGAVQVTLPKKEGYAK